MSALSRFLSANFPAPSYLALPTAGIDISTSGIKIALVEERTHGLELAAYGEVMLPAGTVVGGEIRDPAKVIEGVMSLARTHRISIANVALPEARGYLFEAEVPGSSLPEARVAIEKKIDEYVPLPPADVTFDISLLAAEGGHMHAVGVGYARRVVEDLAGLIEEAHVAPRALEGEIFAIPRALLRPNDEETALIIDIGKTTTKLLFATARLPRYVTTLDIGGHALTEAVEKYFGVSAEEAKQVKAERGIVAGQGSEEYLAAMLSTVSVIREEIVKRVDYWQSRRDDGKPSETISRALLVGGNATVRGLPEYLQASLKIPVELGDVFCNFAPRDAWLPPLEYTESLAYGTAIGLALREYEA